MESSSISLAKDTPRRASGFLQASWRALTGFQLAVGILAVSTLIVFLGTVAQVQEGLYDAQARWFKSWFVLREEGDPWWVLIYPGGYLLGTLFLINMLGAHFRRFQRPPGGMGVMLGHYALVYGLLFLLTWALLWYPVYFMVAVMVVLVIDLVVSGASGTGSHRKLGVDMAHVGLAVIMLGQLMTDKFSEESYLQLREGETKNYVEDHADVELAFTRSEGADLMRHISVPGELLEQKTSLSHPDLPYKVKLLEWQKNSRILDRQEIIQAEATIRQALARLEVEYGSAENLEAAALKGAEMPGRAEVWNKSLAAVGLDSKDILASAKKAAADPALAQKLMEQLKTNFRTEMLSRFKSTQDEMGLAANAIEAGKAPQSEFPPPQGSTPVAERYAALPLPETKAMDAKNLPSAVIELQDKDGKSLHTWLTSVSLKPQSIEASADGWQITLQPRRTYLPYSLTLLKATHDVYQGTDKPKDFRSSIRLANEAKKETRDVDIFMNNPLRYEGLTFFQHQMEKAPTGGDKGITGLQVVKNPSWFSPYYGCLLVSYGLARHFLLHLFAFFRRRGKEVVPAQAAINA